MRKLNEIEQEIRQLSAAELSEFRKWFAQFDAEVWDQQFEAEVIARKLDVLAQTAHRAQEEGKNVQL